MSMSVRHIYIYPIQHIAVAVVFTKVPLVLILCHFVMKLTAYSNMLCMFKDFHIPGV